jgi:hypothetical protein
MPNPKDPIKLAEYKENMRNIALEKGYGKWMKGRKNTPGALALNLYIKSIKGELIKMRRIHYCIVCGSSFYDYPYKKGLKFCSKSCYLINHKKLPEEIIIKLIKAGKRLHPKNERISNNGFANPENRKGKTYNEIYGDDAEKEKLKRSLGHLKRFKNKLRNGCRDKINGETKYKIWRNTIFKRDNYTCVDCGKKGGKLHAHHIYNWAKNPKLRYRTSNGITLCTKCHSEKHPNIKKLILSNS